MEPFLTKSINPKTVIPGFIPTFSLTVFYLSLIVLIPLGALLLQTQGVGFAIFWSTISSPRVAAAFRLSFGVSFLAGLFSAFFGTIIAWVLVKYRFSGRRLFDAVIDLPFAIPTAVSGITLASLYSSRGLLGAFLVKFGVQVAYTPLGIFVALVFIGFPFIVRTVQPALEELDQEMEEAASSLGATRRQVFTKIIFPQIVPALLTGFALSLARALGEYGSVIFIAGNIPYFSEIVPLLIVKELEQFDYQGASCLAAAMLLASFGLLLFINVIQKVMRKKFGKGVS